MINSTDDFSFEEAEKPETSEKSRKEEREFQSESDSKLHKEHPNSVTIPIGRSFISWHSDSGVAILALIILCCLSLLACFIVVLRSLVEFADAFTGAVLDEGWISDFLKIVGQGIVATAGAVVGAGGAAAASRSSRGKDQS